jgi:hypothetical protein
VHSTPKHDRVHEELKTFVIVVGKWLAAVALAHLASGQKGAMAAGPVGVRCRYHPQASTKPMLYSVPTLVYFTCIFICRFASFFVRYHIKYTLHCF